MSNEITTEELLSMRVVPEQQADLAAVQAALNPASAVPTDNGARTSDRAQFAANALRGLSHELDDEESAQLAEQRAQQWEAEAGALRAAVPVLPAEPTDAMVEAGAKERQGQTLAAAHGAVWGSLSYREQDAYRADARAILRAALAAGDPR
jgi:hypothetical protein